MSRARARLGGFRVLAYRSCKDTSFSPTEHITALIGPNGSGKTNLLHGILLLQLKGHRRRYLDNDDPYSSRCRIEVDFIFKRKKVRYKVLVKYSQNQLSQDDFVLSDQKWNLKEITGSSEWIKDSGVNYRGSEYFMSWSDSTPMRWTKRQLQRRLAVSSSVNVEAKAKYSPTVQKAVSDASSAIQNLRRGIRYYSASQFTNPSLCPTAFDIDEGGDLIPEGPTARLGPHVRFIFDLCIIYPKATPLHMKRFSRLLTKEVCT